MCKRKAIILFIMFFATISVFGIAPHIAPKKHCTEAKYCQEHLKCATDTSLNKTKCSVTKQAKKYTKNDSKSIFSGLFSFDFPKLPLEDFILSAQKALAEKMF